jgi:hypothetical protein
MTMIHYQLRCSDDHAFDGWFRDSAAFDEQAKRGLLECPSCGDVKVRRALMAPAVPRKGRSAAKTREITSAPQSAEPSAPAPASLAPAMVEPSPANLAAMRLPDEVRAVLQRMRAEVEKHCEYVGDSFADEARRIHNGETEARAIYGETSPEQAEALAEDGIEVARIPWLPRADG